MFKDFLCLLVALLLGVVVAQEAAAGIETTKRCRFSPDLANAVVGSAVHALETYDDGNGPKLIVGGSFTSVGGIPAFGIASWDGTSWAALGTGLDFFGVSGTVYSLAVYDDGSGPLLYVSGHFSQAGGEPARRLARWDGTQWDPVATLGEERSHWASDMQVYDDGTGPALYLAGAFRRAGGLEANHIVKWDGQQFTPLADGFGEGTNAVVNELEVYDDGGGPALYVGGNFLEAGGAPSRPFLARWDGTNWSDVGDCGPTPCITRPVSGLGVSSVAGTQELFVSSRGDMVDGVTATGVHRWDGTTWSPLAGPQGEGIISGISIGAVLDFETFDDGSGPALYMGGGMTSAGGLSAKNVARWDGNAWSALRNSTNNGLDRGVRALETFEDPDGPALYFGGDFSLATGFLSRKLARWSCELLPVVVFEDGFESGGSSAWSAVGDEP